MIIFGIPGHLDEAYQRQKNDISINERINAEVRQLYFGRGY